MTAPSDCVRSQSMYYYNHSSCAHFNFNCSAMHDLKNLDMPWPVQRRHYYLKVTDAFSDHDDSYRDLMLNDAHCDAIVAVAHDYDYCYCYYYSVDWIGVESSSCFSCDDFGTRFSPFVYMFVVFVVGRGKRHRIEGKCLCLISFWSW